MVGHDGVGEEENNYTLSTYCMQSTLIMLFCLILRIAPGVTSSIQILWMRI